MARRYTDEEKEEILARLDDNFGNVTLTALQMNIPTRTLQHWKRMRKLEAFKRGEPAPGNSLLLRKKSDAPQQKQQQVGAQRAVSDTEQTPSKGEEDYKTQVTKEYTHIRERLMEHINNLIETLTDDPDTAHLRITALSRLLDRVIKLEALVGKETDQVIRIEYKYPDGSIHDKPPWMDPEYVAAQAERQAEFQRRRAERFPNFPWGDPPSEDTHS